MKEETQAILKKALQQVYDKGQEEGTTLNQLIEYAGNALKPLMTAEEDT